ncbi:hypothetical protein [Lactococcus lactis]|uniref:hypothetical protein n=1 Tax=Lactococcus lactis TaxID=1358 RepID=UPI003D2E93DF
MFPSQLQSSSGDIYTNKDESTEYTTVNAMWGYALSFLRANAYQKITYEVTATSNLTVSSTGDGTPLHIGDTVRIQDKNFIDSDGNVGLFLSARVSELEISFTNPTNNKITFSNYIKIKSEVSDDLTARMQEIINANTPYRPELSTTNGTQFKNGVGTTRLGAHIYFGSDDKETIADSYEWSKDGTVVANAQTITVDASGVTDKAVYSFKATVGGKVVASQSVTITNVDDGIAGKTSYTHVAWANNITGTDGFTTVYPNLNLLDGTSNQVVQANSWNMQVADIKYNKSLGETLCASVLFNNADHASDLLRGSATIMIETFDKSGKSLATVYGNSVSYNANGLSQCSISIDDNTANVKAFIFTNNMNRNAFYSCLKIEQGSIATPWMRSASEVTTADYPRYIGQYTDFTQADSTNPSDYTWSLIRGNDGERGPKGDRGNDGLPGKDGVGIKNTVITYAISTSGTIAPTTGWTSSVPSLVKGQYLWTKTVWTYTDNSSETGYSVTYIAKDGNNGNDGIAGKDGVGIKTTTVTYASHTNGITAPTTGYTTTVPSVPAGQFLWTKTVWAYTDNTSETGYSVAMMGVKGERGKQIFKSSYESLPHNNGHYWSDLSPAPSIDNPPKIGDTVITSSGNILQIDTVNVGGGGGGGTFGVGDVIGNIKGPSGNNGDPGKVVSDTEPTTRFKGLTWKYSGTSNLTASDGTIIKPNIEYYYNGTKWLINLIEANQLNVNDLSAISGTYTNGSIKNVTIDGSVTSTILIEKKHILFTFSDSSQNTTNTLELDSQQGYANTFVDSNSGRTRTVQANFQGFFTSDTDGPSAQLTPYGVYVTNGLQTTTVSLGSGINATLAKIGQMCQISINSNSSNVPAGNGVALSGNIPAGWRPAIGTPFEVMMYSGTAFQRPLHITIGTDGKLSIVNASASSYWCFGGTTYMLA